MECGANENCKAILGGQNAGFALLLIYRKMPVMSLYKNSDNFTKT